MVRLCTDFGRPPLNGLKYWDVHSLGVGAPLNWLKIRVGKVQGIQASVSLVCRRNAVQIVQVFQGQSPVCPTQSEVWFSVRGTGAL